MRPIHARAILALTIFAAGCGGRFPLPTQAPAVRVVPTDKSYAMLATWTGLDGVTDVLITRGTGTQLFMLFNHGGSGGPSVARGEVKLFPFTAPNPIGSPFFDPLATLFNPVAIASAQNKLFVLDRGDSCMAKYDPSRGTCEASTLHDTLRTSIILDYSSTWRVREYPLVGGETLSTFTDTTFANVVGVAADDQGNVYVSGTAVVLDTLQTDQRIRTRKFVSRIYRYSRGPKYPGVGDLYMPGTLSWHRDTTWVVLDGTGSSSILDPAQMNWTPLNGGAIFVADRGNNKAKLIGTSAPNLGYVKVDGSETPTGTNFSAPQSATVDESGYLYIVDRGNRRVLRYDYAGNYIQDVNVENNAQGQPLLDPVAVGVDDSLAYVADHGRGQVIRYQRRK